MQEWREGWREGGRAWAEAPRTPAQVQLQGWGCGFRDAGCGSPAPPASSARGAAYANTVSQFVQATFLLFHILLKKLHLETWGGAERSPTSGLLVPAGPSSCAVSCHASCQAPLMPLGGGAVQAAWGGRWQLSGASRGAGASRCALAILCCFCLDLPQHLPTPWGCGCCVLGWSSQCLQDWGPFLSLGVPSLLMMCVEWWAYEIGSFLMGTCGGPCMAEQHVGPCVLLRKPRPRGRGSRPLPCAPARLLDVPRQGLAQGSGLWAFGADLSHGQHGVGPAGGMGPAWSNPWVGQGGTHLWALPHAGPSPPPPQAYSV